MFYLTRQIGERSNLENAKVQKRGCEMKRQELAFKMKFCSTYYLKGAIAPIL